MQAVAAEGSVVLVAAADRHWLLLLVVVSQHWLPGFAASSSKQTLELVEGFVLVEIVAFGIVVEEGSAVEDFAEESAATGVALLVVGLAEPSVVISVAAADVDAVVEVVASGQL